MAVLNQNSALGISGWAQYKTQGKFKSVATINGTTFVVVERGDDFYIEKFSGNASEDADEYEFSFSAAAIPIRASGHNANMLNDFSSSVGISAFTQTVDGVTITYFVQLFAA